MPGPKIHIGTSGWLYKHWIGRFYPEKSNSKQQWEFYSKHFETIEINNSFYKLPPPSVFEGWYENSPKKMLFAVKANRFITHMRKLTQPEEPISRLKFFRIGVKFFRVSLFSHLINFFSAISLKTDSSRWQF